MSLFRCPRPGLLSSTIWADHVALPTKRRLFIFVLLCSVPCLGKDRLLPHSLHPQAARAETGQLELTVMDQNGQALRGVQVILQQENRVVATARTSVTGEAMFRELPAGSYKLLLQNPRFYSATVSQVSVVPGQKSPVEVRLQPVREFTQEIEVTAQPSLIDPQETALSNAVTASEISLIPYPTTRDYRNVLPFIPGVIADNSGQIHVAGSSTQQVQDYLDGFEVSQPAGGALAIRLNPDSLRQIDVRSTRYSALFGKGSGGLTDLEVQDGDNKFRFNATDFIPTLQNVKGIHINNWTPRVYISGPILRDKLWFNLSHEGENDLNIVKELPDGADSNPVWRTADLARLRMNLTPGNVLTGSVLLNLFHSQHAGISPFDPYSVSVNQNSTLYLVTLKDQITLAKNTLLEFGAGFHRSQNSQIPFGDSDYIFTPTGRTGNFYFTDRSWSERTQGFSNLYLRPWNLLGRHQITVGGRADRIIFHDEFLRNPLQFVDQNSTLLRQVTFQNAPPVSLSTTESSAFVQDRWSGLERMVVEAGARWDHDSFLGRSFYSPRIAGTYLLSRSSETKLTAGIGVYYDRTNLSLVSQGFEGFRTDQFFSPSPNLIQASFVVDPTLLTMPRFINWSAGMERRLPGHVYLRLEYLSRHGVHGWGYEAQPSGAFLLGTNKQDKYDAGQITVRTELKRGYPVFVSYTRSNARSNQALTFTLDNFTTGPQLSGPLEWDSPNQLVAWGSYPLPSLWKFKKFDFVFSGIWRSGFPFVTVDNFGRLVSGPGQFRFPDFVTLNPGIEKKFNFHGYRWAVRLAIENVTNRQNPTVVDNNVNSPTFLQFFGTGHRTLNGRIRFLGKQ